MSSESFSRPGAVDLSGLAGAQQAAPGGAAATGGSGYVVDVTEQTFEADVLNRSATVPVVIDFWAEWCGPCKQLSPVLEKLAAEYAGRFVLAKIDVDANQRLAAAAGVQSIPMVLAVVGGKAVPLFTGALPEAQVRQYLDELLKVAAANGVTGRAEPAAPAGVDGAEGSEPPRDTRYDAAIAAIENGDLDGAAAAYQDILNQTPADAPARQGLARVELLRRTRGADAQRVRAEAADHPDDAAAQCAAADFDVAAGHVEDAFARLVETVRRTTGGERDRARTHLLEMFEVVGADDPRVAKARQALMSVLF